jgi:hypothetical protein
VEERDATDRAFLRPAWVARTAVVMAVLVMGYPLLRIADLVSWDPVVEIAAGIDEERARSLGGRFEAEGELLDKARERFVFGWGGYSRNWVFDPETGERDVIPDGYCASSGPRSRRIRDRPGST